VHQKKNFSEFTVKLLCLQHFPKYKITLLETKMIDNLKPKIKKALLAPPHVTVSALFFKLNRKVKGIIQRIYVTKFPKTYQKRQNRFQFDTLTPKITFFCFNDIEKKRDEFLSILRNCSKVSAEKCISDAEEIMKHRFDLLGSGFVNLGEDIDWSKDFKSGVRWENIYFGDLKAIDLIDKSDIKVPWELSRFYHFITLGRAYILTKDERYAKEFTMQFEDWEKKNKPYFGVNWHCAMEVAIRATNWIWGYYFFCHSKYFTKIKKKKYISCLIAHGKYIIDNLEFDKRVYGRKYVRQNGNHYMADLVGLIYLGLVLPNQEAKKWLEIGLKEFVKEVDIQILPDGVHWELSPSYHRLVLEMCICVAILCYNNNFELPRRTYQKIGNMLDFVQSYSSPSGFCPLVRDADDGRLHKFSNIEYRDHRPLLQVGILFFKRKELKTSIKCYYEDALWLLGIEGYKRNIDREEEKYTDCSRAFSASGFYVMNNNKVYLFIVCSDIGMKGNYGGHAHNDCFSFELSFNGVPIITDCGTYIYSGDPEWRNKFRSTEYHNTARIDGAEINRFSESILFGMENNAKPKVIKWLSTKNYDYLNAEHYGYLRLNDPVTHRREYFFDKKLNNLLIQDNFDGQKEHLFEIFFHFYPGTKVEQVNENLFRASKGNSVILLSIINNSNWKFRISGGWASERYGKKMPSKKIILSKKETAPCSILTAIICMTNTAIGMEKGNINDRIKQSTLMLQEIKKVKFA